MPADRPRVDLIFTCQMSCHFSTPIAAGLCGEAVSGADTGRHQLDPSRDNRPQFLPLINRTHTPTAILSVAAGAARPGSVTVVFFVATVTHCT